MTLALALAVALGGIGIVYGTQAYATEHDGRLLPGIAVADVDVGGMTAAEAVAAVEAAKAPDLDRTLTLRADGQQWTTTPRELDSTTDARAAVDAAMNATTATTQAELARMRWLGDEASSEHDVTLRHSRTGVREVVDAIAAELNIAAQDAGVRVIGDDLRIEPGTPGQVLDTDASTAAVLAALDSGQRTVDLTVHALPPERTRDDYATVLLLRQREHVLHLYEDGVRTRSWNVAVGTSGHRTPTGVYAITAKRHMPTWTNPSPNDWGANMPARIGPGVNNPLGVRALNWSAPAIRFHGTAKADSIGRDASKGCVRLSNDDIVELYDLVEVGTTIVSLD